MFLISTWDISGKWEETENNLNHLVREKRREILKENPKAKIPVDLENIVEILHTLIFDFELISKLYGTTRRSFHADSL